jgi:hypothetical protein
MADRSLGATLSASLGNKVVYPAWLIHLDFYPTPLRVWTGQFTINWNSYDWTGTGTVVGFSNVDETLDVRSTSLNYNLTGVPQSLLSVVFNDDYKNRDATLYFGLLSQVNTSTWIDAPIVLHKGLMDVVSIQDEGETATITVTAESELSILEKPSNRRLTLEDQQIDYPNDEGLKFIEILADKQIIWGYQLAHV